MWQPNSIQISKELIQCELDKEVPTGTTVAVAAFMMKSATKETAKNIVEFFQLERDAAKVAWRFLQTGQIVTPDGEILEPAVVESLAPTAPSHPSANSDSENPGVKELFTTYFPDWPAPTSEQCKSALSKVSDVKVIDNALYSMANGNSEIKNPIILLLWILNNRSAESIAQDREILEMKGRSSDSIVRAAMRQADAQIPSLPKPEATQAGVDLIRSLKDKVERNSGRS